jgi:subtilase-type serine protease
MAVDPPAAPADPFEVDRRIYGVWAAVLGETGEIDGDGNAAEIEHDTFGFAGGVDGTLDLPNASLMLGVSLGYTQSDAEVDERNSSADIDSVHLGVYGAWDNERLRLSSALAYAFHEIDTSRHIEFDGIDGRTAEADYDGHSIAYSGEAAYRFGFGRMSVAPLATADIVRGHHDDAEESGADSLNLTIDGEDYARVEAGIGIAVGGQFAVGPALVTAEARLLWEHAFSDDTPEQDLVLAGAPDTPFTVLGPEGSDNWVTIGTGLGIAVSDAVTLSSHYQAAIGDEGSSHQGHFSLGYRF